MRFASKYYLSVFCCSIWSLKVAKGSIASNVPIYKNQKSFSIQENKDWCDHNQVKLSATKINSPSCSTLVHKNNKFDLNSRGGDAALSGLKQRLKVTFYFAVWYALNVVYNVVNKKVLNVLPAPLSVGTIQFFVGAIYSILLWTIGIRKTPSLTPAGKNMVKQVGFFHSFGQLLSMVSLGAGPVSFTHIVKALEPLFSALVSAIVFGKWMHWQVYFTLLPVIGGVGYACLKERSFSWLAFYTAMGSNLAFALRAVVSKAAMTGANIGTHLTSANLFGLVTIYASMISIPFVILGDGKQFKQLWIAATTSTTSADGVVAAVTNQKDLIMGIIYSGLFHYLNNEVMYLALSNVHPVTLAVGNTMKRVFIMVASIIVFHNPVSLQAAIGSAIGISGVLLYSLTKQYHEKLEAKKRK